MATLETLLQKVESLKSSEADLRNLIKSIKNSKQLKSFEAKEKEK